MTQSSVGGFFTGGGKGITWPDHPPKTVSGTITAIHPPEDVLDPKEGKPTGKKQVRIELATNERDPEAEFDDGARTLYVKSYMRGAIGDALRKAGEKEPKVGGTLTVSFIRTEPPEKAGLSASKHFAAVYVPPAVTGGFFNGEAPSQPAVPPQQVQQPSYQQPVPPQPAYQQPAPIPVPVGPARPANIPEAAWATMDLTTRQAIAGSQPPAPAGPTKPPSIDQASWDAMDHATKVAVATTMAAMG